MFAWILPTHLCFCSFCSSTLSSAPLSSSFIVKGIYKSSGFLYYETMLTWTLVLSLKFEFFLIIYRCKLPCKYLFRLIKLSCKKRFVLADFCLLSGSNQGYLGVNQMCGDDDRKVKLRIWRGDRQTETAGSLLPTYSVFYFIIVNNNIYFGYFNVYTFNGNCKLRLLYGFVWGGGGGC